MQRRNRWPKCDLKKDQNRWRYNSGVVGYEYWADLRWVNFYGKLIRDETLRERGKILGD